MAKSKERSPGFQDLLRRDLQRGRLQPVYVIDGEDQLRIEQVVDSIRSKTLDPACVAFNDHTLDGEQAGWDAALRQAQAFPMFGGRQLIWLRRADLARRDEPAEMALVAYFAAPVATTVLIITGEKFDGRRAWLTAAKRAGCYFHFPAPTGAELDAWIQKAAEREDLRLDGDARKMLALLVGSDLHGLRVEIEKLALLQESRGRTFGAAELAELVMDQAQLELFKVTDTIAPGEPAAALRTWFRLAAWGTDVQQLTPLVLTHLRRAVLVAYGLGDHDAPSAIADESGLNNWLVTQKLLPFARRLTAANCRRLLAACLACEHGQKRRPLPPEIAFEQLLFSASRAD